MNFIQLPLRILSNKRIISYKLDSNELTFEFFPKSKQHAYKYDKLLRKELLKFWKYDCTSHNGETDC